MRAVLLVTYQWTQSVTESFTIHLHWHGTVQVTTVCLVVDRWLFSLTLDVRQTTVSWLTGWILLVQTRHTGSDLWEHGGRQLIKVICEYVGTALYVCVAYGTNINVFNALSKKMDLNYRKNLTYCFATGPILSRHFG